MPRAWHREALAWHYIGQVGWHGESRLASCVVKALRDDLTESGGAGLGRTVPGRDAGS